MELTFNGVLALVFLASVPAFAEEPLPAEADNETIGAAAAQQAQERDALQPGVSSEELQADVRRRRVNDSVMDEMDLGRTEITGNQELPKVLYIVPWQKSDPGDLVGPPVNSLLDEVLAPVDRTEFIRQVNYYDDLNGHSDQ